MNKNCFRLSALDFTNTFTYMSYMNIGECKLCGETKELCESHIIPESFYQRKQTGYDWVGVHPKTGNIDKLHYRKGITDKNILCKECEEFLGKFDKHAKEVLFDIVPKSEFRKHDFGTSYLIKSNYFDYLILRKFFISLVWRTSVSTINECSAVNLGPYEQIAKAIIKNTRPDDQNLFNIIIYKKTYDSPLNSITVIRKARIKQDNQIAYIFKFLGYEIQITINTTSSPKNLKASYQKIFNPNEFFVIESDFFGKQLENDLSENLQRLIKTKKIPGSQKAES